MASLQYELLHGVLDWKIVENISYITGIGKVSLQYGFSCESLNHYSVQKFSGIAGICMVYVPYGFYHVVLESRFGRNSFTHWHL